MSSEDSFPEVFATSRMIALMKLAVARAMRPALQPGEVEHSRAIIDTERLLQGAAKRTGAGRKNEG